MSFAGSSAGTETDVAAGNSNRIDAIAKKIATHVDVLISDPLVKDSDSIEQIARSADQTVNVQVNVPDPAHPGKTQTQQQERKQGLSAADLHVLTQVQSDCRTILTQSADAPKLLQVDPGIFDTTVSAASFLLDRAASIQNGP